MAGMNLQAPSSMPDPNMPTTLNATFAQKDFITDALELIQDEDNDGTIMENDQSDGEQDISMLTYDEDDKSKKGSSMKSSAKA